MTLTRLVPAMAAAALLACSPPSAMPPPVPMAEGTHSDLGIAMTAGYGHTALNEALNDLGGTNGEFFFADAQAWILVGSGVYRPQVGLLGSLGTGQFVTLGALIRYTPIQEHNLRLGLQVDGGLVWVRASMPLAWSPGHGAWLWSNPALQMSPDGFLARPTVQIPLGFSRVIGKNGRGMVHLEVGYRGYQYGEWRSKVYTAIGISGQPLTQSKSAKAKSANDKAWKKEREQDLVDREQRLAHQRNVAEELAAEELAAELPPEASEDEGSAEEPEDEGAPTVPPWAE